MALDPISNSDRILLVLRQRLEERAKTKKRPGGLSPAPGGRSSLNAVQAVVAAGTATDRQLRRTVIQGLLSDQFGETLVNDARFQAVADQVTDAISADEAASALLTRVIAELAAKSG